MFFIIKQRVWLAYPLGSILLIFAMIIGDLYGVQQGIRWPDLKIVLGLGVGLLMLLILSSAFHLLAKQIKKEGYLKQYHAFCSEWSQLKFKQISGCLYFSFAEALFFYAVLTSMLLEINADMKREHLSIPLVVAFIMLFLYWRPKNGWGLFAWWAAMDALCFAVATVISGSFIPALILTPLWWVITLVLARLEIKRPGPGSPDTSSPTEA